MKPFNFGESLESPPKDFTVALVKKLQEESYEAGYKRGKDDEKQEVETTLSLLLSQIEVQLETFVKNEVKKRKDLSFYTLQLVQEIINKMFPYYMETHGPDEVVNFVKTTLNTVGKKTEMDVLLHPSIHGPLEKKLQNVTAGEKVQMNFIKTQDIRPNQCEIKWKDGGVSYFLPRIKQEVETAFGSLYDNIPHPEAKDT